MRLLCFNVGSSTVRLAAFEAQGDCVQEIVPRHTTQQSIWRATLPGTFAPDAVVHRIVRGVKTAAPAEPYTPEVHAEILSMQELAPTHDLHALDLVQESADAFPQAQQIVAYDTAFHSTIADTHATYAVPQAWRAQGIRRAGYHGLSCAYAAQWLAQHGNPSRAVHAHLGNGCSVTALLDGKSAATTMGFTPLEGLVMGSRSGSIDPGILLYLQARGASAAQLREQLYTESGLRALCGSSDMREIETRRSVGDPRAELAFEIFVESVAGAIAQMATAIGGLQTITFAGGIGLHSQAVRVAVCHRLQWIGLEEVAIHTIDVQEERVMALAALHLFQRTTGG